MLKFKQGMPQILVFSPYPFNKKQIFPELLCKTSLILVSGFLFSEVNPAAMTGSASNMSVRSFKQVAARVFHRVVELVARTLFSIVYFGSKEKVSPINNMLLLESASSLAFKIRTQKVLLQPSFFLNFLSGEEI